VLVFLYRSGNWLVDSTGAPTLNDFACFWISGTQALHGQASSIYDPVEFEKIQVAVVGLDHPKYLYYTNWAYPPIFFFVLAPLAMLPYPIALLTWELATLSGCVAVIYLIVRRSAVIPVVLASPYTALNLICGQTGLFRASLFGAALLLLKRRPVVAGVFAGCLAFKPQFGVLLPLAFVAAKEWRAFTSAVITLALLTAASIVAFGAVAWEQYPAQLFAQTGDFVTAETPKEPMGWGDFQTIYGLIRVFHGSAFLAWFVQMLATLGAAIIVWLVWRSTMRYSLKAATLSTAAFIATPYGWGYDMAALAVPTAFLAADQIRHGSSKQELSTMILLFAACYMVFILFGSRPLGPVVEIALLRLILSRDLTWLSFGRLRVEAAPT